MGANELSVVEETKVVALLARGDSYAEIKKIMQKDHNRGIDGHTIVRVKKRNIEHLNDIKTRTLAKEEADAQALNQQANTAIKKQLDNIELSAEILAKAGKQYLADEISLQEYESIIKHTKRASLPELVGVSKEMHAQASEDPAPNQNAQDLAAIRAALESGNDVELNQIIFKGGKNVEPNAPPATSEPTV